MAKVALDDELFIEYFNFKHGVSQQNFLVDLLFSFAKTPFLIPPCQFLRCEERLPASAVNGPLKAQLLAQHANLGSQDKSELELAKASKFRQILTADNAKSGYPYLNIRSPKTELNYTVTCKPNQDRDDLRNHLQHLCEDANKVTICDGYFFSGWTNQQMGVTGSVFTHILPNKVLEIEFPNYGQGKMAKTPLILDVNDKWTVNPHTNNMYSESTLHDRYFLIETSNSKIEVILSSGFSYLWDTNKEITCVFREV